MSRDPINGFNPRERGWTDMGEEKKPAVQVRCYETMGIPNSVATCSACKATVTYFPGRAERDGFTSDYVAAEAWARQHVCPQPGRS